MNFIVGEAREENATGSYICLGYPATVRRIRSNGRPYRPLIRVRGRHPHQVRPQSKEPKDEYTRKKGKMKEMKSQMILVKQQAAKNYFAITFSLTG